MLLRKHSNMGSRIKFAPRALHLSPRPDRGELQVQWSLTGRWKTICVAAAVLKTNSKCSFIKHKLCFFACFCLASAASKTFFNGLLSGFRMNWSWAQTWKPLRLRSASNNWLPRFCTTQTNHFILVDTPERNRQKLSGNFLAAIDGGASRKIRCCGRRFSQQR